MKIVSGLDELELLKLPGPIVTWGVFDGVHRGHQKVLEALVTTARAMEAPTAAITFDPHPEEVLFGRPIRWLATIDRRLDGIEDAGIDVCCVQTFSRAFSEQGAEEFVKKVVVARLQARGVVLGSDAAFGNDRGGNLAMLVSLGRSLGLRVVSVPPLEEEGSAVSSTRIRNLLAAGDVAAAARLLGRPPAVEGRVVSGARRGKFIGVPTANLEVLRQCVPARGVYGGRAIVGDRTYPCVVNIGSRPTFGPERGGFHVEAHLLDYAGPELYGESMAVEFTVRLRDEKKFAGPEALKKQIEDDIRRFRSLV